MLWELGVALADQVAVTKMTSPFRAVHIQPPCRNLGLLWRTIPGSDKLGISIAAKFLPLPNPAFFLPFHGCLSHEHCLIYFLQVDLQLKVYFPENPTCNAWWREFTGSHNWKFRDKFVFKFHLIKRLELISFCLSVLASFQGWYLAMMEKSLQHF